jgi:hypothetical protein
MKSCVRATGPGWCCSLTDGGAARLGLAKSAEWALDGQLTVERELAGVSRLVEVVSQHAVSGRHPVRAPCHGLDVLRGQIEFLMTGRGPNEYTELPEVLLAD